MEGNFRNGGLHGSDAVTIDAWLVKTKPPLNRASASPWRLNFLPRCKMQGHHRGTGTVEFLQNGHPAKHLSMNWVYSRFLPVYSVLGPF